jgi:ribonuclease T
MNDNSFHHLHPVMKKQFSGYLPVVVDLETTGVNPIKNGILEIAAIPVTIDNQHQFIPGELFSCHVLPFKGAILDPVALEINRIDPFHPFRFAIEEKKALETLFEFVEKAVIAEQCRRAILVGHNAHFDLSFIKSAMQRCHIKKTSFHAFTCFDTATLAGAFFGQTILARALQKAGIPFDKEEAHSAIYDAAKTAELFCYIVNNMRAEKREK